MPDNRTVRYDAQQIRNFLSALVTRILNEGIRIRTEVAGIGFQNGEAGGFEKPMAGLEKFGPVIRVLAKRGNYVKTPQEIEAFLAAADQPLDSLLTLAHEMGHYRSYAQLERARSYENALSLFNSGQPLTADQKLLILEEEERAWRYGSLILSEIGSENTVAIEQAKVKALDFYKHRLA